MNPDTRLGWMPAHQIADAIRRGELSAMAVIADFLSRVEQLQPVLHAFITVSAGQATERAAAIDATHPGDRSGILLGVPYAAKDNIFSTSMRTTMGSRLFESYQPPADALVIEHLGAAGASLVGKTNLPEFSMGGRTRNLITSECRNPWNVQRTCAGSSGGSGAAVAAGLVPIAIGTDDGGSIRLPAALNGVFGLYPSPGQVPLEGVIVGGAISGAGPLSRDVADAALFLDAVKPGQDFAGRIDEGVSGLRAVWAAEHEDSDFNDVRVVETARAAAFALEKAGAIVEDPGLVLAETMGAAPVSPFPDMPHYGGSRVFDLPEAAAILADPGWEGRLAPSSRPGGVSGSERIEVSEAMESKRRRLVEQIRGLHDTYDVILTPTIDQVAPLIPEDWSYPYAPPGSPAMEAIRQYVKYTHRVNIAGCTAASVPAGFVDGMPVGLQVIGPPGGELAVLRVARALEQLLPWADKRPPSPLP